MKLFRRSLVLLFGLLLTTFCVVQAQDEKPSSQKFELQNVFDLEYVTSPQIAPGGEQIIYRA
ncbi:MAG: hypothetical protein U5J63_09100 [Fodinibius sp.]|nr:hypothetical protein [Fodinibius sp.]